MFMEVAQNIWWQQETLIWVKTFTCSWTVHFDWPLTTPSDILPYSARSRLLPSKSYRRGLPGDWWRPQFPGGFEGVPLAEPVVPGASGHVIVKWEPSSRQEWLDDKQPEIQSTTIHSLSICPIYNLYKDLANKDIGKWGFGVFRSWYIIWDIILT